MSGGFLMVRGVRHDPQILCWQVVVGGRCVLGLDHTGPCQPVRCQPAYARLCTMIGWEEPS